MTEEQLTKHETTIVPEVVDRGGEKAAQVYDAAAAEKLGEPFVKALEKLDEARGYSLTSMWRQCIEFHADNDMLRTNLAALQTVLAEQFSDWTKIRKVVGKRIEEMSTDSESYIEEMKAIQELNDSVTKAVE